MRRHRYTARSYRSGNVKRTKKQAAFRVLFVFVAAAMLFLLSVLLGRYLKSAADESKKLSSDATVTEITATEAAELYPDGVPIKDASVSTREICAADIDITSADADTLCKMIDGLSTVYNAVSVRLSTSDGKLVYASPALMEYVRLDPDHADNSVIGEAVTDASTDENEPDADEEKDKKDEKKTVEYDIFENLKAVIAHARSRSLYTVCVINADGAISEGGALSELRCELDSVLAGEISAVGCDEMLITDLFDGDTQLPHETLKAMISYLARLRARSGDVLLGVNLSDGVYLIPQNASTIKTLSEYADFLSISIETSAEDAEHAYSAVYDNCYSLKGNFSMYNLRALMLSDDADISSAIYSALYDLSAKSFQFSCYVASPDYSADIDDVKTDESTESGSSNENASRREDYENEKN